MGIRIVVGTLLVLTAPALSLRAYGGVDYATQIKPILTARCVMCHGALKQKSGLRLDAGSLVLKGGKHGAVVVGGKPDESILVHAISGGLNGTSKMPEEGDPLKADEIALIRQWINEGARTPADEPIPAGPESHWSFKPPVRPAVPGIDQVKNVPWVRNPIDAFIAAEHDKRGLTPRPQADKPTLLRRVTLDLIGIPPTRAEMRAFLEDGSADAYEKVVDRLLASPGYGQRWGRHWMDVWRYSDWAGYGMEIRYSQPHIWRWRDWIIESLNADKPYDQMVREMLAGDEIAPADPSVVRATGYLARSYSMYNRTGWMDEVVEHTSKGFLGLTLNCAKCHDHMFDPLTQREFFQFRAIFEPYNVRVDPVPGSLDGKADGVPRVFDANENAPTYLFIRGDDRNPKKDEPLPPTVPAALGGKYEVAKVDLPPPAYYVGLREHVRKDLRAAADAAIAAEEKALGENEAGVTQAQTAYATLLNPPAAATTQPIASAAPFLEDDFAKEKPAQWEIQGTQWKYAGGKLLQNEIGPVQRRIRSLADHPKDFTARASFKITGGQVNQRVGISFDGTAGGDEQIIYLTPYTFDPKVATFYYQAGAPVHFGSAKWNLAIKANQLYSLRVDVRDTLVNIYVDDVLTLVHRLIKPRQPGRFALITDDATAEFAGVRVAALPSDVKLAERTESKPTTQPAVDSAKLLAESSALWLAHEKVAISKLKIAVARAERALLDAKTAADDARYATPSAANANELALAAGRAQRSVAVCKAELEVRRAQHVLSNAQVAARTADAKSLKALSDSGLKLIQQQVALAAARKALDQPSADYAPITALQPPTSTGRRLALAKWITSRDNPLPARVAVNHIWMRHFAAPLVSTVFDFGLNGQPPTHPALLDWLAVELMDHNWSMKHMHRLMVTSSTYRMRSDGPPQKSDPDNVYHWRTNVRRMEAEVVRDSVLAVAGNLDTAQGGPDLDHAQGLVSNRRSVYFRHAYEKQMTFLMLFDAPSTFECYRRIQSVMPQQALALANSPLAIAQSRRLASKLTQEIGGGGKDPRAAFIRTAFEQILSRPPTDAEKSACEQFLAEQAKRLGESKALAPFDSGGEPGVAPSADPNQRAREDLVLVLINHNDFVTIR